MRHVFLSGLCVLFLLVASCSGKPPERHRVVVLDFINLSPGRADWAGRGLADTVAHKLGASAQLEVVDVCQVKETLRTLGVTAEALNDRDTAMEVVRQLGADTAVVGSYSIAKGTMTIRLHLVNAESGAVEDLPEATGGTGEIFDLLAELTMDVLASMKVTVSDEMAVEVRRKPTRDLAAFKWYCEGLQERDGSDEQREAYLHATETDPEFAEAFYRLGIARLTRGNSEEAVSSLREALSIDPRYSAAQKKLAEVLGNSGQYEEAIAYLNSALASRPHDAQAHHIMGRLYLLQEKYGPATKAFRKALTLNPDLAQAYLDLGRTYRAEEEVDKEIETLKRLTDLRPQFAEGYDALGMAYARAGRYDEAIETFNIAVTITPDIPLTYVHLGNTYDAISHFDEAVEAFRKAVSIRPDDVRLHTLLGLAYSEQRNYRRAAESFLEASRLARSRTLKATAWLHLGLLAAYQLQCARACLYLEKALDLKWDDYVAHVAMGYIILSCPDECRGDRTRHIKTAYKLKPDNPETQYWLAYVYERYDTDKALTQWKKYVNLAERHPEEMLRTPRVKRHIADLKNK